MARKVILNSEFVIPDYIRYTTSLLINCGKMHQFYKGLPFCFLFSPELFFWSSPTKLFLVCLIFPALMNRHVSSYIQRDIPICTQAVRILGIPGGVPHLSEQHLLETECAQGYMHQGKILQGISDEDCHLGGRSKFCCYSTRLWSLFCPGWYRKKGWLNWHETLFNSLLQMVH